MEEQKKKKRSKWLYVFIGFIVLLGIQYIVDGPAHGDKRVARTVERLRQDSIALQGNFTPMGTNYTYPQDVVAAVDEIYRLGNPYRFDSSDSAFLRTDPRTGPLVSYITNKRNEILAEVLPMWRRLYSITMAEANRSPRIICRTDGNNDNIIYMYSLKYISQDGIKDDYIKHAGGMKTLGFKEVVFAPSPDSPAKSYSLR